MTWCPRWLQGMVPPTLMLWVFAITWSVLCAVSPGPLSVRADLVGRFACSLILSWWTIADASKRGRTLCYDYGTFAFFAWPVILPIHLFRTRRLRAFLTLLCFAGIWLVAVLFATTIYVIRMLVSQEF